MRRNDNGRNSMDCPLFVVVFRMFFFFISNVRTYIHLIWLKQRNWICLCGREAWLRRNACALITRLRHRMCTAAALAAHSKQHNFCQCELCVCLCVFVIVTHSIGTWRIKMCVWLHIIKMSIHFLRRSKNWRGVSHIYGQIIFCSRIKFVHIIHVECILYKLNVVVIWEQTIPSILHQMVEQTITTTKNCRILYAFIIGRA